jgi:hypothetical protein
MYKHNPQLHFTLDESLVTYWERSKCFFFKKLFWLNSSLCNDKKEIQCTYIQRKGFLLFVAQNKIDPKKKWSEVTIFRQWVLGGDAKTKIQKFCYYFLVRTLGQEFGSFIGSLCMIIISSSLSPSTWQNWKKAKKLYPLWKRERSKG